ncbi:hypothetical protein OG345_41840 (plasmid) [Streptomyces sp. NBC_01220]|uniref:hypothetical protein n=1 Tax=Streptomyces sp. NBC_01220 TaxID=2903781 RepID=UPI00352DAFAB|nr:hypothetical protein OG345_41840 [Streptomyces sp. NBC_01220]
MATNTTLKKTTAETTESAPENVTTDPAPRRAATVVGPPLGRGQEPETVTLSHHLRIDGTDYTPGARILVSPDYARRLRGQGFTART